MEGILFESLKTLVPENFDGTRLDHALSLLFPDMSLRQRRRILEECRVFVDGKIQAKGHKVNSGAEIHVLPHEHESLSESFQMLPEVKIIVRNDDFVALYKPAGIHTESLVGKPGPSVEDELPKLFPGTETKLLNRLDQATTGVVIAAFGSRAELQYLRWQDQGKIEKHYFALVQGRVAEDIIIENAMDTAKKSKVRVLKKKNRDPLRHTLVKPQQYRNESKQTLVRAVIKKGQRHQIRAHLAFIGHPIVGDSLYGPENSSDEGILYLHHFKILMPEFEAGIEPEWLNIGG